MYNSFRSNLMATKILEAKIQVLVKLKCSECEGYLSCPPIYLTNDHKAVCGRCQIPEEGHRNIHYEQLAEMFSFPCCHQKYGCKSKIPFLDQKRHDDSCEYRPYTCPVDRSGNCEWLGPRYKLLEHCQSEHQENVQQNPCVLIHNIASSTTRNYFLAAFNSFFLVHSKVCLVTKKIYHSVRYIGDPEMANGYSFDLDITNGGSVLNKEAKVNPQGCMTIQEDLSLVVGIGSMLQFLGSYGRTTFTVTIKKMVEAVNCPGCGTILQRHISSKKILHCSTCLQKRTSCENSPQGCAHIDMKMKAEKHKRYFCKFNKWCLICKKDVDIPLEDHYKTENSDTLHKAGVKWQTLVENSLHWCVILSQFCVLIGAYRMVGSAFKFYICTTLSSGELQEYDCVLTLTNPSTGYSVTKNMSAKYDEIFDWKTEVDEEQFDAIKVNNKCSVMIDLKRLDES